MTRHEANPLGDIFERSLIIELLRVRDGMREHFKAVLHKHKVSDQHWRILKTVARDEPVEVTAISRTAVLPPASLSRLLRKMELGGLLRRAALPDDLRRIAISLTPSGRQLHDRLAPQIQEIYRSLSERIGSDLLLDLESAVHRVNQRLHALPTCSVQDDELPPRHPRKRRAG